MQIHASGFRNPYDLVIATVGNHAGKMYVPDNGPNGSWGDVPVGEGTPNCTNQLNVDGLDGTPDSLHLVTAGYYGGHPNPTRGNDANTFHGESPIVSDNPIECDYLEAGTAESPALDLLPRSSNGITEYTTNNFDGAMTGDLLLAGYQGRLISRVTLNNAGTDVVSRDDTFATFQSPARPLDVTVGPGGSFPGTVWIADLNEGIRVMETERLRRRRRSDLYRRRQSSPRRGQRRLRQRRRDRQRHQPVLRGVDTRRQRRRLRVRSERR